MLNRSQLAERPLRRCVLLLELAVQLRAAGEQLGDTIGVACA
jgi:hypothetical protein